MPNKDRPLVERHAPKKGVGWLLNDQEGKVCSYANDSRTAHAQWVVVETRPLRGDGHQSSYAGCAITQLKYWKPCRSQAVGSFARLSGDAKDEDANGTQENLMRWHQWSHYQSLPDWFTETVKISIILFAAFVGLLWSMQIFGSIGFVNCVGICLLLSKAFHAW